MKLKQATFSLLLLLAPGQAQDDDDTICSVGSITMAGDESAEFIV